MKMNVQLNFPGNCAEAFAFYKSVFGVNQAFVLKYSEGPQSSPADPSWNDKILHTSIPLGSGLLMGCDEPGAHSPGGGFKISIEANDQTEANRIFQGLKEGGTVQLPMGPTFWSPLFGMCTDKFGVGWMVGVSGPGQE